MAFRGDGVTEGQNVAINELSVTSAITVMFWLQYNYDVGDSYIAPIEGMITMYVDGNVGDTQSYWINTTGGGITVDNPPALQDSGVHHTALTLDNSTGDLISWIDGGVNATTGSVTDPIATVGRSLNMGGYVNGGGAVCLDGLLWDVRFYNRALSGTEMNIIFNAKGSDNIVDGLVGRYLLNEGSHGASMTGANSVIDISPSANHGTPQGLVKPVYDYSVPYRVCKSRR